MKKVVFLSQKKNIIYLLKRMTLSSYIQSMIDASPRKWVAYTTVAVVLYLSLGVFFGFDVCDNGQYMTMYANMFTAPDTVGYHFMYYLSGIVGGVGVPLDGAAGYALVWLALPGGVSIFSVENINPPHHTLRLSCRRSDHNFCLYASSNHFFLQHSFYSSFLVGD